MFVPSVVGDVSVDNEASVMTSSISRICWLSFRRCSRDRVYVYIFIGGECACVVLRNSQKIY
jgi:hypothetical protein